MREIEILGNFKVRFALNWAIFEKIWQKEPRVRFANVFLVILTKRSLSKARECAKLNFR